MAAETKAPTKARRFNLRANPLGLLGGFSNLAFDVGVMDDFTIGPSYSRVNISFADTTISGQGFGIRGNSFLYGPRLAGDWYFGPSVSRYAIDATHVRSGQTGSTSVKVTSFEGIVGYQWMWEHFNVNTGAGLTYLSLDAPIVFTYPNGQTEKLEEFKSGTFVTLELSLGWAF